MRITTLVHKVFMSLGALAVVAPAWIGAVLPTVAVGVRTAEARESRLAWDASWGTKVIGCAAESATPVFTLNLVQEDGGRKVLERQGEPSALKEVAIVYELNRVALPAQNFAAEFIVQTPGSDKKTSVSLTVVSDVVAFQGKSPGKPDSFMWGVHTHNSTTLVTEGEPNALSQTGDIFFIYGTTASAEKAKAAAGSAGPVIAARPAAAPSCYSACMAGEHARHFANMNACLAAAGIVGGGAASACILGCLGSGPLYPVCVTDCLAAVGVAVGVAGAYCVTAYVAAMLGAAIGCGIGCWTCW